MTLAPRLRGGDTGESHAGIAAQYLCSLVAGVRIQCHSREGGKPASFAPTPGCPAACSPLKKLTSGNRARESRGIASAQKAAPRNDFLLDVIARSGVRRRRTERRSNPPQFARLSQQLGSSTGPKVIAHASRSPAHTSRALGLGADDQDTSNTSR